MEYRFRTASVDELARSIRGSAPARWAAFVALAHTPGGAALALLLESAGSEDAHVRRIAVECIGSHRDGRQLDTVVLSLLGDTHSFVVRSACKSAARQRLLDAHDSILLLLSAPEIPTRVAALGALRELWQEADFDDVVRAFKTDESDEVRKAAAWTLRSIASPANWQAMFAAWRVDPLPRHRKWACELAALYGNREVLTDLRGLTKDLDGHVRHCAAQAVRELEARGRTSG